MKSARLGSHKTSLYRKKEVVFLLLRSREMSAHTKLHSRLPCTKMSLDKKLPSTRHINVFEHLN